jgi:hypothetical protein
VEYGIAFVLLVTAFFAIMFAVDLVRYRNDPALRNVHLRSEGTFVLLGTGFIVGFIQPYAGTVLCLAAIFLLVRYGRSDGKILREERRRHRSASKAQDASETIRTI